MVDPGRAGARPANWLLILTLAVRSHGAREHPTSGTSVAISLASMAGRLGPSTQAREVFVIQQSSHRRAVMVATFVTTCLAGIGLTSQPVQAAPIIQEVFYDASGTDSADAFTEIFGLAGMSLDGWSLVGINGGTGSAYRTLDLTGAVIPADGLLVIATSSADASLAGVRDFTANVDWQNGPDTVRLLDPFAVVIDALQYGDAGVKNVGFGLPAPDAAAGSSLSRDLFGANTGDNFADFIAGMPSPGVGPAPIPPTPRPGPGPTPVPEPSTLVMLGAGILAITVRRWC